MRAFYSDNVGNFLNTSEDTILGQLSAGYNSARFYQLLSHQIEAWYEQIQILKEVFSGPLLNSKAKDWYILLEYSIPRRQKRIDAVVLTRHSVLVLEFKIGAREYQTADKLQVEDYCLDLRDFHAGSSGLTIVPLLVGTKARNSKVPSPTKDGYVKPVHLSNKDELGDVLLHCAFEYVDWEVQIDPLAWSSAPYQPTPTIIEAAQALYAGQNVREISRSHAGIENLTATYHAVSKAIESAKKNREKTVCFVTGVPGSGKTLAGLNVVHNRQLHDGDLGVFLSGNGPLVRILREALARDFADRNNVSRADGRREVSTFVQNVHDFLGAYFENKSEAPVDRVVVFDEAQRAWDKEQSIRKFRRHFSEPEMLLEIMDRHKDWAVFVALIGGGQEINSGEAGLAEWGRAIAEKFQNWNIMISPELKEGDHSTGGKMLFKQIPTNLQVQEEERLHLKVSVRSFRAEKTSDFVASLLMNEPSAARGIYDKYLSDFEIGFTRSLDQAKQWLMERKRGWRRIGLTASSGARRIKAYGLEVKNQLDYVCWFLNGPEDVRSSFYLEDVATEFSIQGLELDWTCLCWGADLRYDLSSGWEFRNFRGTKWQHVRNIRRKEYILNKYRVLLTRAREGLVIWVPKGDYNDSTRLPQFYDFTANYLSECGIPELTCN
ncbi:hypothetical protein STSP2_01659 [Anaerohalosphaera lusitana]|uniref:Schlafen group 3-like DNA/RNA helicase domain-containing protein n=1 Tax=Anaerohalosphaera lusitana TaxID=1936003 RepID=A0A1U9NL86_9BACT|nr:DUF2075 domain-containing protein [Anaerohalosphaera lusitana]AQT68494.1 hypothetical protein STSP2_01659 [Anaerohalosphaera lusitana]